MNIRSLLAPALVAAIIVSLVPTGVATAAPLPPTAEVPTAATVMIPSTEKSSWQRTGSWASTSVGTGAESSSSSVGSRATLQFVGSAAEIVGTRVPSGGDWRMTLDCTKVVTGNSFSVLTQTNQTLASFSGLTEGLHTVVIEVLGTQPWPSTGSMVSIAGARVTPGAPHRDAMKPYIGGSGDFNGDPWELRRPGCGSASSLLEVIKSRTTGGQFAVPGANGMLGEVNSHALTVGQHPSAIDPLTVGGAPREAASLPILDGVTQHIMLALPDRPRTLVLALASDEAIGRPVSVAVTTAAGDILPFVTVDQDGVVTAHSSPASLPIRSQFAVLADLRDVAGAGGYDDVRLTVIPDGPQLAELTILGGRTTDVAFERAANQLSTGYVTADAERLSAPASAFLAGPVVLSRVLADANRYAWTGTQATTPTDPALAVPLRFGTTPAATAPSVNGVAQPVDTVTVQLPQTPGQATTSVVLRFDMQQRCRTLTASVGIDDSTPSRSTASVSVGVYGDGEAMTMHHNGSWAPSVQAGTDNPVTNGYTRQSIASQLRDLKTAWTTGTGIPAESAKALTAIINAEYAARSASATDGSHATMTYPLPNPATIGAGSTRPGPQMYGLPQSDVTYAHDTAWSTQRQVKATPEASDSLLPIAVDLLTARGKEMLTAAATRVQAGVGQVESALPRLVSIVISGTPGAVVDLVGAGVDCVSAQPGADGSPAPVAMPLYSQLGVPPLFLPAPRNAAGDELKLLAKNPVWWDLACPNGPSTTGLEYTATRERTTTYVPNYGAASGGGYVIVDGGYSTVDRAVAQKPACGFPADQLADDYGEFAFSHQVGERIQPEYKYVVKATMVKDSIQGQIQEITSSWTLSQANWYDKVWSWASNLTRETSEDSSTIAIWLLLLPIDLPGAIVFNPITAHALPLSAQVALGAAMMSPSLVEGAAVKALPGASGLALAAGRGFEASNELLLLSTEQAARSNYAVLKVGDELAVGIPLKTGTSEVVADVRVTTESRQTIGTDAATSRMASTNDFAPWVSDVRVIEPDEPHVVCKRGDDLCDEGLESGVASATSPQRLTAFEMPASGHSFGGRYASAAQLALAPAAKSGPAASAALKATEAMQSNTIFGTLVSADQVFLQDWREEVGPDAPKFAPWLATDTAPLYYYTNHDPDAVFAWGLGPEIHEGVAIRDAHNPSAPNLALYSSRTRPDVTGAFVSTSRDPDLLGSGFDWAGEAPHWRYTIARPEGGGGFDMAASLAGAGERGFDFLLSTPNVQHGGEVTFLSVHTSFIVRADYMEFDSLSHRFVVTETVQNERFSSSLPQWTGAGRIPSGIEAAGASVNGSQAHKWADFDWAPSNAEQDVNIPIVRPDASLYEAAAAGHGTIYWSRGSQSWRILDLSRVGLSAEALITRRHDGFQAWLFDRSDRIVFIPEERVGENGAHPVVVEVSGDDYSDFYPDTDPGSDPDTDPLPTHFEDLNPYDFYSDDDSAHTAPAARGEWPTAPITINSASGVLADTGTTYRGMGGVHVVGVSTGGSLAGASWRLQPVGDGSFRILNTETGTALHATGNPYDNAPSGASLNVVATPESWHSAEQRWTLTQNPNGTVRITSTSHPGLSLLSDKGTCAACGSAATSVAAATMGTAWGLRALPALPTSTFALSIGGSAIVDTDETYRGVAGAHVVGVTTDVAAAGSGWKLQPVGDGTYRILSTTEGTALHATADPFDGAPGSGAMNVAATGESWNSVEQRWRPTVFADGSAQFESVGHPGLFLRLDGGTLSASPTGAAGSMRWYFGADASGELTLTTRGGSIVDAGGSYRGVAGASTTGISTAPATTGHWVVERTAAGSYRFINSGSGRALQSTGEALDSAPTSGAFNVAVTEAWWNHPHQQWLITRNPNGSLRIESVGHPGLLLTVKNGAVAVAPPPAAK
ncbi:RICIN domain-containing protein [Salinibacterium soli]|uniref:RICIN domain-containing protein n=1 Tax=Antiquaquibacter soli TaxID=3064523 RepID=A0ABT9BUR6_9MICO|nr:RICIN domain-containing protein [Protaetiibacter sp. WY-16]MDO7883092.1 RICIN domain-containing protein [Protaetiibacter sp. WY-16]